MYRSMLWFFLIGAAVPILLWAVNLRLRSKLLSKVGASSTRNACLITDCAMLDPHACNIRINCIHPSRDSS